MGRGRKGHRRPGTFGSVSRPTSALGGNFFLEGLGAAEEERGWVLSAKRDTKKHSLEMRKSSNRSVVCLTRTKDYWRVVGVLASLGYITSSLAIAEGPIQEEKKREMLKELGRYKVCVYAGLVLIF